MTVLMPDDDDWTEATNAHIPRVDLVGKAANGSRSFLLMKAQDGPAGLVDAATVRDLIAKATPAEPTEPTSITAFTGSPDDVAKALYAIRDAGKRGAAEAMHAIHAAAARAKDETMPAVIKADDADLAADVVANPDEELPDADEVAAATPETAPGDPDDPTSAAWEAVDAARARQALELTIALQRLVEQAADREAQEVAVADDPDDAADNLWTLGDVSAAIDAIVGMLAPFAVTEQAEADQLTAVTKAGRVLSTANESAIRGAVDALQKVLASLPAATPDDAAPVAKADQKEATMADTTTITKAKGDPQVAVYTEDGKLVGTVDQTDISPITSATAPAPDATDDATDGDAAAAPADAPDAPAAPAAPAPAAPATEDAATIPGTDTVQSPAPAPAPADDVTKAVQASFTAALEEVLTPITKQLGETAGLSDLVKELQERVELLAKMPDDRKSPKLNGSTGTAGLAARDGSQVDPLADLKKAVETETDPARKVQAQTALAHAAIRARFAQ